MTAHALILQLLAATPEPPAGVDELLETFARMIDARQELIDLPATPLSVTPEDRVLIDELARRDAAWQRALDQAHRELGAQRVAATKVRAYGPL